MFELSIYEYEDTQVLGRFATMDEALIQLGLYMLGEGGSLGALHPHITEVHP